MDNCWGESVPRCVMCWATSANRHRIWAECQHPEQLFNNFGTTSGDLGTTSELVVFAGGSFMSEKLRRHFQVTQFSSRARRAGESKFRSTPCCASPLRNDLLTSFSPNLGGGRLLYGQPEFDPGHKMRRRVAADALSGEDISRECAEVPTCTSYRSEEIPTDPAKYIRPLTITLGAPPPADPPSKQGSSQSSNAARRRSKRAIFVCRRTGVTCACPRTLRALHKTKDCDGSYINVIRHSVLNLVKVT